MGKLGKMHATFLPKLYPGIAHVICHSKTDPFDDVIDGKRVKKAASVKALLDECDVLVTTSSATKPYINPNDIRSDTYLVVNLSLMDFDLDVIKDSKCIIVDDWEQNKKAEKVFKKGVEDGSLTEANVSQFGDILFDPSIRPSDRVFINPLGMGLEDVYVAKKVADTLQRGSSGSRSHLHD